MDFFKKYLLQTAAHFAAPGETGAGPDEGDERIEVDLDDDETVADPVEPTEEDEADAEDPDADGDEAGDEPAAAARPASRGERDFGKLRAETRRLAEENARITREMQELRSRPAPVAQPVETPAQRAERLALLSPEDRMQVMLDERLAQHAQQQQHLNNQLLDQSDRAAFQSQAAGNPLLGKLAPEVERRLADLRARGENLPRHIVATFLLGEKVLAQQGKGKPAADARRRAQTARPANGRGDVQGDRGQRRTGGDPVADMERRFGDVQI